MLTEENHDLQEKLGILEGGTETAELRYMVQDKDKTLQNDSLWHCLDNI